ncbi:MAG: (Fe-S)-binding protein [Rhodocyclaceae bacterium]|nr:(Fe-S)-binding protein [Rhodocyclaceae bacterium]MBX3668144.1 (Fe-S)-binding protein [Rhodocyclaceae bacterium]
MDAVRLMEREGVSVHFPQDQSCCGQPAYTSGDAEAARKVARAQMDLFKQDWPIVVPSGSCGGMMHEHWPKLFAGDPVYGPKAVALAVRVFELAEFIVNVLRPDYSRARAEPCKVALHTSCSARREMGTRGHGLSLLASLPGVEVVEHVRESECCGFGGTFSLRHPDISGAIVRDKVDSIAGTGCQRFITADCGCMLNISTAAQHRGVGVAGTHMASFVCERLAGESA